MQLVQNLRSADLTLGMQVSAGSIWVATSIILETTADWQLMALTADTISNELVLTAALPLSLTHTNTVNSHTYIVGR